MTFWFLYADTVIMKIIMFADQITHIFTEIIKK